MKFQNNQVEISIEVSMKCFDKSWTHKNNNISLKEIAIYLIDKIQSISNEEYKKNKLEILINLITNSPSPLLLVDVWSLSQDLKNRGMMVFWGYYY